MALGSYVDTELANVKRELANVKGVSGSVESACFIERESYDYDEPDGVPRYRFGPFSSEADARQAIHAVTTVVTQLATRKGWEIVTETVTRTSV